MGNQGCCKAAELCSALCARGKEGKEAALCMHIIPQARVNLICKKWQAQNFGVWQPPNVSSLQQSRWELCGDWARHVLPSGQLQLAVLLMGIEILSLELCCSLVGQGLWQKAWLLSLCTPSWQDNSHPVWFCGLRSFLFFHLLPTQKAGLGSWKRSDKQKWFCSQGSGHFYSALTKTLHWLQLWLLKFMHA